MNIDPHDSSDDSVEREWQAQELALRQERSGRASTGKDLRVLRYRMLARALLQPLDKTLPADFAREVARRVEARAPTRSAFGIRFELVLSGALVAVFGLAVSAIVAFQGSHWLHPLVVTARILASPWALAFATCALASVGLHRWHGDEQT
jgi:hypothetical protein